MPGRGAGAGSARRSLVLAVLCLSLLVVSLDNTVLNVALPTISRDLHASSTQLQWIVDAYAIVFAGLLLALGSLGDRLGRRRVFSACLVVFGAGSAASAFSGSAGLLIASRAFMGVGAAGIMPSTLSILTNVFSDDAARARAIGIWSGTTGIGIAVGPIVGGWLLDHYWWGSVFLINVPVVLVGLAATRAVVPESRDPAAKRPDPVGTLLSVAGLGLLIWGIIEAPTYGWASPIVLAAMLGGVAVLALFVAVERRSDHPMLELAFFSDPRFSAAVAAMGLVIFALMGALFLLTQYLQFSLGLSALQTGLRIGPVALVILVMAPTSSLLVRRVGTKAVVATGMAVIAGGMLLLSRTTPAGSYLDALPAFLLLGAGTGLAFAPCTESVMGSLPFARAGVGAATNSASMQVGGALGVGVLGSLLNTRYQAHLAPLLAGRAVPPAVHDLILGTLGGALAVAHAVGGPLGAALAAAARQGFVHGMDVAVTVATGVALGGAAVVLLFLPARRPRTEPGAGVPARGSWREAPAAWEHRRVPIRVFLVDDHEVVRAGVRGLIDLEEDLEVVGEASNVAEALARIPPTRPDVAVLDVRLPDGDGISLCREVRSRMPELACLMLTSFADDEALLAAIMAGAAGYVLKQIRGTDLVGAIRKVGAGASLLDPASTARLMERLRAGPHEDERLTRLTEQERRILDLVAEGKTNRQIGETLFLAEKTVKNYVSNVLAKLGMQRRTEAAVFAARLAAKEDRRNPG